MAINRITDKLDVYEKYDFGVNAAGETIQGKMLLYTHRISDSVMQDFVVKPEDVKEIMAKALAEEMLKNGLIEFTKTHEGHTGDWVFRARVFVVPDDKVRILRQNGY